MISTEASPRGSSRFASCVLGLLIASPLLAQGTRPPEPPPWFERFELRRKIVFERNAARGDGVLLRVGTARVTEPDARDVRVVLDHRYPVPFDVLEVGPGDTVLLRFPVYDPEREHHVYLGSSGAPRFRGPRALPLRGPLLELYPLGDASCDEWRDLQKVLRTGPKPLGILAPRSISLGIPPLGLQESTIARYTAMVRTESEGAYKFETVSEGGSFALIDGKLVASWAGFHGLSGYADPKRREEHSGTVLLRPGVHSIEYVVATRRGGVHLLAWAPPGEERTRPMRSRDFVSWLPVRLEDVESRGDAFAEIDWKPVSDTGSDAERHDLAELELRFCGDLKGRVARRVRWKFGDGQTAEGPEVRHVYLRHGDYEVSASVEVSADLTLEAARTVAVRFESLERTNLDALLEEYHRASQSYDLRSLPPDHIERIVWLRSKDDRWQDSMYEAVEAWYERGLSTEGPTPPQIEALGLEHAVKLVKQGKRVSLARRILGAIAEGSKDDARRDRARVWLARLESRGDDAKKKDASRETFETILDRSRDRDARRRAGIFLADMLLREDREDQARKVLTRLEEDAQFRVTVGDRRLSSGARSLSLDSLLREERIEDAREEIERWEWELPADTLTGALQIQRARLLLEEKRAQDALDELESIWRLDDADREKPRALLLAAQALGELGRTDEARRRLDDILRDYPHRPESREASQLLEKLDSSSGR